MKRTVARTATETLKLLWAERVFSTWNKKAGLEAKLAEKGNHFSAAELGMALKRAPFLTRRGNKGRYEYIQKFSYVDDEAQSNNRNESVPGAKPSKRERS